MFIKILGEMKNSCNVKNGTEDCLKSIIHILICDSSQNKGQIKDSSQRKLLTAIHQGEKLDLESSGFRELVNCRNFESGRLRQ